jgi:CheY-like chemotaxis protein
MIQTKQRSANTRSQKFANLRVLLAEDNDVNQLLAKSILQYWGAVTEIAVTGFEVLNLLHQDDFDVILMDIQMPEKSGIEAAIEIRKLTDLKKKNIPIIALTANGLKGEEKKYMSVGMDDFLTKPFKERDLYEVVDRVLQKKGCFNRSAEKGVSLIQKTLFDQVPNEKLYDLKVVEEIASGNKDFILSLVNIFLETIPQNSTEMLEAGERGEWDRVSKLAHKLKSTIDTLDITTIKTDIRTIELDAKKQLNVEAIKKLIFKVNKIIHTTAEQLRSQFSA